MDPKSTKALPSLCLGDLGPDETGTAADYRVSGACSRLLTPRRLSYAFAAGLAIWLAWLASLALGRHPFDLAGHVLGTDYLQFYSAGYTLRAGESARLYDLVFQTELERALVSPDLLQYYAFITPPFLAWIYQPLAALPYALSFAAWSLLGLSGLWASLRLLRAHAGSALRWSLTFFPIFASISYGQNSLLSLAILSAAGALWIGRRPLAAGLVASLLLYKPQLLLGVVALWLLDWRRSRGALLGLLAGSAGLAGLSAWLLPEASRAYLTFARDVLPDLPRWQQFPLWNLHTVRGFWRLLLPSAPASADVLTAAVAAAALFGFARFWRQQRGRPGLLYAAAVALTLVLTPHAMIYDWALLLIPGVLLWREEPALRPRWQLLYTLVWLAAFVSGPLATWQLRLAPAAIQVSVPALLLACGAALRWLDPTRPYSPTGMHRL